jgi:hypothetical protein
MFMLFLIGRPTIVIERTAVTIGTPHAGSDKILLETQRMQDAAEVSGGSLAKTASKLVLS